MGARCTFTTPAPVTAPPGWLSSGSTAHRAPAHHPSRCSPPRPSAASAGSRMTGPDTAGQLRTRAATWRQRRPTSPASPTRWASTGSRSWVILAAARTPWPAPRSGPGGSWPRSAYRGLPRSPPRPGLVRGHGPLGRRGVSRRRRRTRGARGLLRVRRVRPGGIHPGRSRRGFRCMGYAQTTDTSRSSTPASWPWTGSASMLVTAEPEPADLPGHQAAKPRTTSRTDLLRTRQPRD